MNHLKIFTILTAAAALFLFSCAGSQSNQHQHEEGMADHEHHEGQADHSHTATADPGNIGKDQAKVILTAYFELKDALVATDGNQAGKAASDLLAMLAEGGDQLLEKIRADVQQIAESTDPEEQRNHFQPLSENVYTMVKATGANESVVYRQYCPMAMNNQGAFWLSAEKEIFNPYFGDKMLHCGSVKEEL